MKVSLIHGSTYRVHTVKTIEDQGEKQIKALEEHGKQLVKSSDEKKYSTHLKQK